MKKFLAIIIVVLSLTACTSQIDIEDSKDIEIPEDNSGEYDLNLENAILELDLVE
ncbi:hypothetical protein HY604_01490 [Candidatus Peregrinibacteria bacterium]|nr:hypothetical protein [Candidatus Peregrinibacteria bacterium]